MNQTRYVNIRDLHPTQRELTGLPFGLYSEENEFLRKLLNYVHRYHRAEDKDEVLFVLQQRYETMVQNAYALTVQLMRKPEEVHVLNQLTPLIEGESGMRFQLLQSDITVDVDDGVKRYKQPGLVFIVGEDNHTWIRTALRVEQLEEFAARTPEPPPELPPSPPELKLNMQRGAYSG
ncbi:hypothetical protein AVU38_gp102 [Ralstonia phage RSL2]|uniref:Uncharacterized protein n=1 Tax=Ralstonia phage RSL2 TaxID=1585840 RepID=A0A0A8J896_9CAUD|nr:hypothetical protein AVU38_gp102 [Ralstonia phage RSL2]BAQ02630.1 hypothetical protein [Ralstonia phage RSL2]